jgi:hypothetical protein
VVLESYVHCLAHTYPILHVLKFSNITKVTIACNSFQAGREWAIRTKESLAELYILKFTMNFITYLMRPLSKKKDL